MDAGRAKEKVLDSHGAAARFQVTWISKASAEQRAGRAGRTGPGHCYRLPSHPESTTAKNPDDVSWLCMSEVVPASTPSPSPRQICSSQD